MSVKKEIVFVAAMAVGLSAFGLTSVAQSSPDEALRFARVFGDGMVLQREKPVPVWGFAEPGTKVTVSFAGQSVSAATDVRGRWQARLAPMAASLEGRTLSVSAQSDGQTSKASNGQVLLTDVRVGEVWILAGQSNMQYGLRGTDGWADAQEKSARGELSALRFFSTDLGVRTKTPRADLKAGAWHATTDTEAFGKLSASGFHCAEALLPALGVPVGLVNIPRGGTQMFQWVDAETYASDERFAACLQAKGKKKAPCEDWNGKAAPLAGLAVRGVVWYQGESDSWNPYPSSNFAPMLEKLIGCWRRAWGDAELPFVIAQLPSMDARFWPRTREAQDAVARKLKGVFLANLIDTGWRHDVHPHDKPWVGPRLANAALRGVYGRTDIAVAPRLKGATFATGNAIVAFDAPVSARGGYRRGFELKIGGTWRQAASAAVRTDGTVEVLAADAAACPEGVRYLYEGWAKPDVWLYGADGTPAFAFTTVPADLDQALEPSPATLFFAGDSTLDDHGGDESKFASWGSSLRPRLMPGMRIVNYAKCGRSTKSFRDEGWWDKILSEIRPGDFVLIQFGHNDQKLDKPKVAVPQAQFKTNLWQMVREVRARRATPFFATPIVRLTYEKGRLVDKANLDAWAQRMREVAHEANVRLIDMRKLTHAAAEEAGEDVALTWNAPGDRTHPAKKGAQLYADLFLRDVTSRKLEIGKIFENGGDGANPPFPEWSAPRAVTRGPHEHFLASYFAIDSWSPNKRYMLVLETDVNGRLPEANERCTLGVVDLEDGNRFIPVTTTACWNFQEAAMAFWVDDETILFNDVRDGKFKTVIMNWKTGKDIRVLPRPVSAVSEDRTWAVSVNYARLSLLRPDYGYAGPGQDPQETVPWPENDGLWTMDLKTGASKLVLSVAATRAQMPEPKVVPGKPGQPLAYHCHTVISKDGEKIFFLARSVDWFDKVTHKIPYWRTTSFTVDRDGRNLHRCFKDNWEGSHFNWAPDGSHKMLVTATCRDAWDPKVTGHAWSLVEFEVGKEEQVRRIGAGILDQDWHCVYSPDGKFMSGETYWNKYNERPWVLVRLSDGMTMPMGAFYVPEKYRGTYWRCDLHARYRRDGRQIAFNSVHEGSRQVYVRDIRPAGGR